MASNTSELFPLTGLASGLPSTLTSANIIGSIATGTNSATVVTSKTTNASIVRGLQFLPAPDCAEGLILIYYNDGSTKRLAGHVTIPPNWRYEAGSRPPTVLTWMNPNGEFPMVEQDSFAAGLLGCSGNVSVVPLGGDY